MTTFRTARLTGAVVLLLALTFAGTAVAAAGGTGLKAAVRATARYHNLNVATAAGYGLFVDKDKIACIANPPLGTMGIHYVNGTFVGDSVIDATKPEALVYEPTRRGKLKLVALEYIVFQGAWEGAHGEGAAPPSLFGEDFHLVPEGNRYGLDPFYELHAWVWKYNPSGMFFEWNPRVSCHGAG
jgi:hypothetical protein